MVSFDKRLRARSGAIIPAVLVAWNGVGGCDGITPANGQEAGRVTGAVQVNSLDEISGLATSRRNPGVLWVHDDGDIDRVYAVRTSGERVARVDLGAEADDCEDMAIGPGPGGVDFLYLADIGDNDAARGSIPVVRCAEPLLSASTTAELDAQQFQSLRLRYPDGPHDAETLLVDPHSGDLLIVTKEDNRARVYRAAAASWDVGSRVTLERIDSVDVKRVSAGDISRDGRWILLRCEETGWLFERRGDEPIAAALARPPQDVPVLHESQDDNGEAVAFHPDGGGYYTVSEGERQPICFFPLP